MTRQPSLRYATKPRRANPEAALQRTICEHLRLRGVPGLLYLAIKNEGKRSAALGAEYKRQGMRPGASDLLIIIPDKTPIFLELKAEGGKLSPEQVEFRRDVIDAGCLYAVTIGIDATLKVLEAAGVIKPAKRASA